MISARSFRLGLFVLALATGPLAAQEPRPFPKQGWLPKTETGALRLLEKHPEYDGRGVVVAIFDTGVDPGVDGLQTTSDGRPKIIDMVDGSGSGDVDTSTVAKLEDGTLTGLTGRTLHIPKNKRWRSNDGEYHLGWKRAYELFPRALVARLKRKRREAWDEKQRALQAKVRRELIEFDRKHPELNRRQQKKRDELATRVKLLDRLQSQYQDPGPIFDCVVFHDGKRWLAAVDTDEDGRFDDERLMTNYRAKRQYASFGEQSQLNFAVNIYDQGDLLSIVTDCGTHGTHVAGIVAANYPDRPEWNGLAPGAQIVSVKIGDSRLGSSSTGTGQVRGLTAVLRNHCDLINMSYGGATGFPNQGLQLERMAEIVQEHGVLFVASAGNNGPALSTVGSPGGTSSALLGVGAYVTPELMRNAYAQRGERDELAYTWTSRGPTMDGDRGVDISAPGGAVSPVARWSLEHRRLANGTSMSAPNACGNLALLISGLKAEGVDYSPRLVRRAAINTARPLANMDPLAHGAGLIQVDAAYQHLVDREAAPWDDAAFKIRIADRQNARGVYLREPHETTPAGAGKSARTVSVEVKPHLADRDADNSQRADFDLSVQLQCDAPWVEIPKVLALTYAGKSFELRVDVSELPPGVHYAEVTGRDAMRSEEGPLFRIPVTVVRAASQSEMDGRHYEDDFQLTAGEESRHFLHPPPGATWMDVTLTADQENDEPRRYVLHVLQPAPQRGYGRGFQREYVTLRPGQSLVRSFPVASRRTVEVCLAQYWSSLGDSGVTLEARFHGIQPERRPLVFSPSATVARLPFTVTCGDQWIAPQAKLTLLRKVIPADDFQLRPVSVDRDELPQGRVVYESITSYRFQLPHEATVSPRVAITGTPKFSEQWQSRIWQIFDVNKRLVQSGTGGDVKLPKGEYVLRSHLRHERPEQLQAWRRTPLWLDEQLKAPIDLACYADPEAARIGGSKWRSTLTPAGASRVAYFRTPQPPKHAGAGDLLLGRFYLGDQNMGDQDKRVAGAGRHPDGYPIECPVQLDPKLTDSTESASSEPTAASLAAKKADQLQQKDPPPFWLTSRRARLKELRVAGQRKQFQKLLEKVLDRFPDDIPTLQERLLMLDDESRKERLPQVVDAADAIIKRIPKKKIARRLSLQADPEQPQQLAAKRKAEQQRDWLTDALYRKGRAIAYMDLPPTPGQPQTDIPKHPESRKQRNKLFESNYQQLQQWVDMTDPKYVLLNSRRERRHGRYASALLLIEDLLKEQPTRALLHKKRRDLLRELGWEHLHQWQASWKTIRFPPDYPPF